MKFQFPSNGKVRVDLFLRHSSWWEGLFQFPSNGKVRVDTKDRYTEVLKKPVSIPFKREGKGRHDILRQVPYGDYTFQFPSNGKVRVD